MMGESHDVGDEEGGRDRERERERERQRERERAFGTRRRRQTMRGRLRRGWERVLDGITVGVLNRARRRNRWT